MRAIRWMGWLISLVGACGADRPAPATLVRLTLTGGPNPGSYQSAAAEDLCQQDLLGPGSWGVQLTDWNGPRQGLRSLQLALPSASRPQEFYLGLVFGDFFAGTTHEIETRPDAPAPRGTGQATVFRDRRVRTIAITGQTQDSVALVATITCHSRQGKKGRGR